LERGGELLGLTNPIDRHDRWGCGFGAKITRFIAHDDCPLIWNALQGLVSAVAMLACPRYINLYAATARVLTFRGQKFSVAGIFTV
jgi:hypothetical protein